MLAALSTQNKLVLGGMGLIFIVYALLSSFVFPRRDPNFPGRRRNLFLVVTAVLFVCMLLAVEFFAVEEEEPGGREAFVVSTR